MRSSSRSACRDLALALALAGAGSAAPWLGGRLAGPTIFDFGPNDPGHLRGFRSDWERDGSIRFRWTSPLATVSLPLTLAGEGAHLRLRMRRHFIEPAHVRLIVEGRTVAAFEIRADPKVAYRIVDVALPPQSGRYPFLLRIEAPSDNPRPLGVALDWMELAPGPRAHLVPQPSFLWAALLAVLSLLLSVRLAGAGRRLGGAMAGGLAAAIAAGTAADFLAAERVVVAGLPILLLTAVALALLLRWGRPTIGAQPTEAGILACLALFALALRLALVLHPRFFYPDVKVHALFAWHLAREGLGPFIRDFTAHQFQYSLGLDQYAGHWYAFPYPPAFYLLCWPVITLLGQRPEVAVSVVPAAVNSLEVLLVFALGRRLGMKAGVALLAAAAVPVLPIFLARLSLAYFPALLGHAVDLLALLYLLAHLDRLERWRTVGVLGALLALALLTYTQALLAFGLLLPVFLGLQLVKTRGALARRRWLGLAAAGTLGALVSLAVFYGRYLPILGDMRRGVGMPEEQVLLDLNARRAATQTPEEARPETPDDPFAGPGLDPLRGLERAGWRLWIFYGPYAPVALLGLVLLLRRIQGDAARLALAWALTYLLLNLGSGGLPGPNLIHHGKDVELVAPLCCLGLGLITWELWRRWRPAAVLFGLSFWAYGLARGLLHLARVIAVER